MAVSFHTAGFHLEALLTAACHTKVRSTAAPHRVFTPAPSVASIMDASRMPLLPADGSVLAVATLVEGSRVAAILVEEGTDECNADDADRSIKGERNDS